jgi:branched-chain amino acid transport system ATP-binding protein
MVISTIDDESGGTAPTGVDEDAAGAPGVQLVGNEVSLAFGGVRALDGVSFAVRRGEIYAIVGPNGAGKSSLLNCISGVYRPGSGELRFEGIPVNRRSPRALAEAGIGRTFQNINLYPGMSVVDNIMTGRTVHMRAGLLRAVVRPLGLREDARHRETVERLIAFLGLERYRRQSVEKLGYGIRKKIDLARALALEPRLLLLDEPMAGMNLEEKQEMARAVLDARAELDCTVVLVEHDMGVVSDLSDRALVLDWGRVIAEGAPAEVLRRDDVIAAYLGTAGPS